MGTLLLDRQPHLLSDYHNIQWNVNDPAERNQSRVGFARPKSTNPFFFRNNPHPGRVRHIKGLLGHPVCAVLDAGYREGNIHNDILTNTMTKRRNVPSRRETFVPGVGLVSLQPTWVEQLQSLARKATIKGETTTEKKAASRPSTRQASRQSSRGGNKPRLLEKRQLEEDFVRKSCSREAGVKVADAFTVKTNSRDVKENNNNEFPVYEWQAFLQRNLGLNESEVNVAQMLAQILKTDSLDVIKHWLMEAPEKEKEVVLEMIRAVSNSNLEYREVMNKLMSNSGGEEDVQSLRNEYEKMVDMKDIKEGKASGYNSPSRLSPREKPESLLDVIKENLEADMANATRASTRASRRPIDMLLPALKREDEEIEVLRSQLASRSSVNVFSAKPGSRRSPR